MIKMYVEIITPGKSFVKIKFHEGFFRNRQFEVPVEIALFLVFGQKIPVNEHGIQNIVRMMEDSKGLDADYKGDRRYEEFKEDIKKFWDIKIKK